MKLRILIFVLLCHFIFPQSYLLMKNVDLKKPAFFYTSIKGPKVDKFKVELLGLVNEQNMGEMILFAVDDVDILLNGGIAEGMSGSPVYQGDKLIGSIAYGIGDNPNYGLIMPMDYFDAKNYNFEVNSYTGKSIAVTPVRGDISFDALGTVTFGNGEDVYIYGHKLENRGNIAYFLKNSEITKIIPTQTLSFKIGNGKEEIGLIEEDTKYGLKGYITDKISYNRFNFDFYEEGKPKNKLYFDIVKNKKTKEFYLEKSLEAIIDSAYRHSGYKSAEYSFDVVAKDGSLLYKDNDFIAGNDNIKVSLANTIFNKIMQSTENKYKSMEYDKINVQINLFENEKMIYINNVEILGNVFLLGDKLKITFSAYVHQRGKVKIVEEIDIPLDFPLGPMELELVMDSSESDKKSTDMKDYLENLQNKSKNNEILVRFKNKFDKVVYKTKIKWDYYIISDENFKKEIVIDSFEASN